MAIRHISGFCRLRTGKRRGGGRTDRRKCCVHHQAITRTEHRASTCVLENTRVERAASSTPAANDPHLHLLISLTTTPVLPHLRLCYHRHPTLTIPRSASRCLRTPALRPQRPHKMTMPPTMTDAPTAGPSRPPRTSQHSIPDSQPRRSRSTSRPPPRTDGFDNYPPPLPSDPAQLERVLTEHPDIERQMAADEVDIGPPPDGGREAWCVVASTTFVLFCVHGLGECGWRRVRAARNH